MLTASVTMLRPPTTCRERTLGYVILSVSKHKVNEVREYMHCKIDASVVETTVRRSSDVKSTKGCTCIISAMNYDMDIVQSS